MKIKLVILISIALAIPLSAAFEKWTNQEGKDVILDLLEVTGEGNDKAGVFAIRNGRKVTIQKTELNEDSAAKMDAWKPFISGESSVFDEIIDGNLVILDGKEFKAHTPKKRPAKYVVFYYTASWCPPCRVFTPELVKFYNKHKTDQFEIILVTSDRDAKSMESYAAKNNMPWPHLKFDQVGAFKSKFNHGVRGIPAVIICDLEGKIVSSNGRDLNALEQLVK